MRTKNSAGGIVVNPAGKIAAVYQFGTSWSLPKGGIKEGEDSLSAARRKIYEETGIQNLTLVKDLGKYSRTGLKDRDLILTIHMYHFTTDEIVLKPTEKDINNAEWFEKDEIVNLLTHEKDRQFARENLKRV